MYRHVCICQVGTYGGDIIIPYNTIFTQGYNNYYHYGTIRYIYATSLNAFINL